MQNSQKDFHKKLLGRNGEKAVAKYLEKQGYKLIKRNYRTKCGEADLVCEYDGVIVFVEVKTRSGDRFGTPAEAVDERKREKYRKIALCYMAENGECAVSFAVAEVTTDGIRLIENAF